MVFEARLAPCIEVSFCEGTVRMQASFPHNVRNALSGWDAVFANREPLS